MAVINSSEQWNYMGEVSRLLIASPRQGLMETFFPFFNQFSSLIGSDAPYPFYINIIIILFSTIIPQMIVIVLCGHWNNHLHWHSSLHPDNS